MAELIRLRSQTKTEAENRPVKKWKIMLVVLLVLTTSLTGFILVKRHQAKSALEAYRKELIAQGEQLDQATFRPEPTEEQRARWRVLEAAVHAAEDLDIWRPPAVILLKHHPDLPENDYAREWYSEESLTELRTKFDQMKETYSRLLTALDCGPLPFVGDEANRDDVASQVVSLLSAHLALAFNQEDRQAALDDLTALIHLAQAAARLPFPDSRFVEVAMTPVGEAIRGSIAARWLGVHELERIQASLTNLDLVGYLPNWERAMRADTIADVRRAGGSRAGFDHVLSGWREYTAVNWHEPATLEELPRSIRVVWNDLGEWFHSRISRARFFAYSKFEVEHHNLRNFQIHLGALDEIAQGSPILPEARKRYPPHGFVRTSDFASDFFGGSSRSPFYQSRLRTETTRRLTILAIALERYRLVNGRHPDSLQQLTPDFLGQPMLDPWTGDPLNYRKHADGTFTLYSVGPDGHDNGGAVYVNLQPRRTDEAWNPFSHGNRDIVWWQLPAAGKTEMPEKSSSPASVKGN